MISDRLADYGGGLREEGTQPDMSVNGGTGVVTVDVNGIVAKRVGKGKIGGEGDVRTCLVDPVIACLGEGFVAANVGEALEGAEKGEGGGGFDAVDELRWAVGG